MKNINAFKEAEADGQPIDNNESQTSDYTEDSNNQSFNDNQQNDQQQSQNNQQQDNQSPQNSEYSDAQQDDTEDYTQGSYDDGGDDGYQDDGGDGGNQQGSGEDEQHDVDDIKAKEEEIYSSLTPEQLDVKHKELKNRFLDMFDSISELSERIGNISADEENIHTLEYITNKLIAMKDMVCDYVNDIYQTKSYTENSINYNKFLATLNGINKLLEQIKVKKTN